jgi:hypothetical protein
MNLGLVFVAVVLAVIAAVVLVICGALVEVFRQISDIRTTLDLDDVPLPLALGNLSISAADLAMPDAVAKLPEAIVVVLSRKCATCISIAQSFAAGAPETVWFVLQTAADEVGTAGDMLDGCRDRVVIDIDSKISEKAGVNVAPSVLSLRWGQVERAQAVSSVRQVMSLVPTVRPIGSKAAGLPH